MSSLFTLKRRIIPTLLQLITAREQVEMLTKEYEAIIPELEKIDRLIEELPTLTVDELLLRNPAIDAEIQAEIADNEWSPDGRLKIEDHHH
jgi:hypothetical protein